MRSRVPVIAAAGLTLAVAVSYLLWPLASDRYPVALDTAALERKQRYLSLLADTAHPVSSDRPNVVLILADDLGRNDITAYHHDGVETPNINSIGRQGVRFTQASCASPICAPSRAALLTGRHQQRFGMDTQPMSRYPRNRLEYFGARLYLRNEDWVPFDTLAVPSREHRRMQGLPRSEITLADLLGAAGYATTAIGKWHVSIDPRMHPGACGFQSHYGFYEAFSLYSPLDDTSIVNYRHDYFANRHIWKQGRTGMCAIRRDGREVDERRYLTFAFANEAAQLIDTHRDSSFFLYLPFNAPHTPFQAPRSYVDRFAHITDMNRRVYAAMIAALDDAVGTVLAALERNGLADNTLVIFASDNGGATYTGATTNAPMEGGKFISYEGGLAVPLLMRWPRRIEAGSVRDDPVSLLDILPTAAAAARVTLPDDRPVDGVDLLAPQTRSPGDERLLYWRNRSQKAVRQGPWKLFVDGRSGTECLYRLDTRRREQVDFIDDSTDVAARLRGALAIWERDMQPPAWTPVMYYRFTIHGKELLCPL